MIMNGFLFQFGNVLLDILYLYLLLCSFIILFNLRLNKFTSEIFCALTIKFLQNFYKVNHFRRKYPVTTLE